MPYTSDDFAKAVHASGVDDDATRRYELPGVRLEGMDEDLTLIVRPASEDNPAYLNAMINAVNGFESSKDVSERVDARLRLSIPAYAQHVITGWNAPAPYTSEQGEALLRAMMKSGARRTFLLLKAFCEEPTNFSRRAVQAAALVGN